MKTVVIIALFLVPVLPVSSQAPQGLDNDNKKAVVASISERYDQLTELSDRIWAFAELAFLETNSSRALAEYAQSNGFRVTEGVAEIPTAFTAEFGSGEPVIGILGEFDALPGLSQKAVPEKTPLDPEQPGHGCGHNLFGVASLGAAIAIKELIESGELKGTVRFYGTPAEERFFGKLWMIRAGIFDDVDIMMDWHPGPETKANVQSSLSLVDFVVEFFGATSHASSDPWRGRSASDALELYTTGINYFREHVEPSVRNALSDTGRWKSRQHRPGLC